MTLLSQSFSFNSSEHWDAMEKNHLAKLDELKALLLEMQNWHRGWLQTQPSSKLQNALTVTFSEDNTGGQNTCRVYL